MITKDNIAALLKHPSFGFTKSGNTYKRKYSKGTSIEVNIDTQKITYAPVDTGFKEGEFPTRDKPAKGFIIHRDTTLNFSANENFVCLVCVHLLLQKGYEPRHIVFEPAFKVGHVNKPSYGDILVFDKEYSPLVLIENKTFGTEFSKEWNLMQKDGGQLFSYLGPLVNVMGLCQNLVLFAADFAESDVILKNHIITLKDNEKRLKELENAKSFADAQGKFFEVWDQTYGKSFETKGIFEDDIAAYSVGKLKYTIKDLKGLSHAEIRPIYHEFATILRNHAITDFEHSFYILIDLFLCKITDERNNPDDLQFYYKGITRDTPKEYCNRLLKLYQMGKQQLFNVEVVNKEEEDIRQIFDDTNRSLTNGLFAGIKALFEEMKFYNIKKFNFIDVENREEFEMNFQILIKIAALIQDINLSSSETNHFFGDLFEGLLSKNVHQTEGQFFTPLPIVNFIIKSLPQFPDNGKVKVLDYACGAGHFLTEFVKRYPKAKIYGIEKSQTLSQVAKIATIINGSQDSRIVFKDSLSLFNTMDVRYQGFDKDSFDCIIANPPYSVKGFLSTMEQKDRDQFELAKIVEEKAYSTNKSIECFFVERAHHFLKKDGLMGIVLPSSILSNENIYTKTREIIFANFNILAISVMNSRTFGSTGTNTVILFAQKVKKNAEGLLQTFMEKKDYTQYTTSGAIDAYIQKQGYPKDEYFSFMQDNVLGENLKNNAVFKEYESHFKPTNVAKTLQKAWFAKSKYYKKGIKENSTEYKSLMSAFLSSDAYKKLEEDEYKRHFIAFAKDIESRKLKVFIQIENNLIAILQTPPEKVNSKSNKAEVIRFLGYDWSNRKGDEGIKYLTSQVQEVENSDDDDDKDAEIVQAINSIKYIETPLYNPNDDNDVTKYAYALRKHISDRCNKFSFGSAKINYEKPFAREDDKLLKYAKLTDLVDFGRTAFNLAIRTNIEMLTDEIKYRVPVKEYRLSDKTVFDLSIGKRVLNSEMSDSYDIPVYSANVSKPFGYINKLLIKDFKVPSVIWGIDGDWMVNCIPENKPFYPTDHCGVLRCKTNDINPFFLSYILETSGRRYGFKRELRASIERIMSLSVKIPSASLQQLIVSECQKIDVEFKKAEDRINALQDKIEKILSRIDGDKTVLEDIAPYSNVRTAYSTINPDSYISTDNLMQNYEGAVPYEGVPNVDSVIEYHKGDILVSNIRPYLKKIWYADKSGGCSPDVLVFRTKSGCDSKYVYYNMRRQVFFDWAMQDVKGLKMPRGKKDNIIRFSIPLPSLAKQKSIVARIEKIESEIASLKEICDGATARKEAILHRELIMDDKNAPGLVETTSQMKMPTIIILSNYRTGCIPFYSVRAACGYFEESGTIPSEEAEGWVDVSEKGIKANKSMFVVKAVGDSMKPRINDGDLCVFELYGADASGSREGEIVLTQSIRNDDDYGCSFTIKKYHSEKLQNEDGSWQHTKVELQSLNPEFSTIEVSPEDASSLRTIGILRAVL